MMMFSPTARTARRRAIGDVTGEGYVRIGRMSENSLGRMVLDAAERELAGGLAALGLEPGDRVALLGETRPEWTLADAAILAAGLVVVPVYQTNSPDECRYVVDHSGARAIILEDAGQLEKIEAVRDALPGLEHVISMEDTGRTTTVADLRGR